MSDDLLADLRRDFGDELVGLNDFARLLGLSAARAAQLRTDRNRDPEFPLTVRESERSHVHRLDEIIDWYVGSDRVGDRSEIDAVELQKWRLGTAIRKRSDRSWNDSVRAFVLAIAVVRLDEVFADLFDSGAPAERFIDRAQELPVDRIRRRKTNPLDRPLSHDPIVLTEILDQSPLDESGSSLVVSEINALWRAIEPGDGHDERFASAIDSAVASLAVEQRADPQRAESTLGVLIAVVLSPRPGDIVYEPTCGECEALLRVGRLVEATKPEGSNGVLAVGRDRNATAVRIGRARLCLFGVESSLGTPGFDTRRFIPRALVGADRILVDPGPATPAEIEDWFELVAAHLAPDGRAVVVTPLDGIAGSHVGRLPPTVLVVLPVGTVAGVHGPSVLWVHDRALQPDNMCRIIDLRRRPAPGETFEPRLASFAQAAGHHEPDRLVAAVDLLVPLSEILPAQARIDEIDLEDLPGKITQLAGGLIRELDDQVTLSENRAWALWLATELERLIDGHDPNPAASRGRSEPPANSPDGVLSDESTEEARRVLRRIVDGLAGERRGRRGQRPGRG
jgi:hypothetical protein